MLDSLPNVGNIGYQYICNFLQDKFAAFLNHLVQDKILTSEFDISKYCQNWHNNLICDDNFLC